MWTLLTQFHQRFNLILLAPAVLLLAWRQALPPGHPRLVAALLVFFMIDVPLVLGQLERALIGDGDGHVRFGVSTYVTRLLVLALFVPMVEGLASSTVGPVARTTPTC